MIRSSLVSFRYCLLILLLSISCEKNSSKWPTAGWPESTPAAQGMDLAKLSSMDEEFASGKHGYIDGMLVIRNGHVVYSNKYDQDYETPFRNTNTEPGQYNYTILLGTHTTKELSFILCNQSARVLPLLL